MSLPVVVDPSSKKASYEDGFLDLLSEQEQKEYAAALDDLNSLYQNMLDLSSDVPPQPNATSAAQNKTRNQQILKMRDTGIQSLKHGRSDAVKYLTLALGMSLKKAPWESTGQNIEELASILEPRADAFMAQNLWAEANADASLLVLFKGNDPKNHVRKGRCLKQVEKYDEAKKELNIALALSPGDSNAKSLLKDIVENV